jgi:hypothetical protein
MSIIIKKGFDFAFDPSACENCPGFCCFGETGKVWVSQTEIFNICNFLHINCIDFKNQYLNHIDNRFTLKERYTKNIFECIFFDHAQRKCQIYDVRPIQCRNYPFWNDCTQALNECLGICFIDDTLSYG